MVRSSGGSQLQRAHGKRRHTTLRKVKGDIMKKTVRIFCTALLAATAAMASPVFAEDAKPAGLNGDDVKKALGMSVYLQGGYTYNANASSPAGSGAENDFRVFDHKADSFGLDLMQLVFAKDPATGVIGYKVKVSAGETAKFIHASGLGTQPTGTY